MKIEEVLITDIKPYPKNNKQHPKEQVKRIADSIKSYGFNVPVLIDKDCNIIAGHGRLEASKMLEIKNIPCIRLENLTEDQIRAFRIMDNKSTESEWDFDNLKDELKFLQDSNYDMALTGFNSEELEGLFPGTELDGELKDVEPEEADKVETDIKRGDIILLGRHRLMCGDSTSSEDVGIIMQDEKADMCFTDPPYGMFLDTDFSVMKNNLDFARDKNFIGGRKYDKVIGDHNDFNPDFINNIFKNFSYCKEIFLWGADYYSELLIDRNKGSWIIWDKRANNNDNIEKDESSDKMYGSCFEMCWSKNKHKRDIARIKWASVFGTEKEFDHKRHHPTQKPILLSAWFLSRYSKEKDTIIDLFGGSGSTLIAAEQLNRKCIMMEIDEKYCEVICRRWEKLTNQKREVIQ